MSLNIWKTARKHAKRQRINDDDILQVATFPHWIEPGLFSLGLFETAAVSRGIRKNRYETEGHLELQKHRHVELLAVMANTSAGLRHFRAALPEITRSEHEMTLRFSANLHEMTLSAGGSQFQFPSLFRFLGSVG